MTADVPPRYRRLTRSQAIVLVLHFGLLIAIGANLVAIASFVFQYLPADPLEGNFPYVIGTTIGAVFLIACVVILGFMAVCLWLWRLGSGRVLLALWDAFTVATFVLLAYLITLDREFVDAVGVLAERAPWTMLAILVGATCSLSALVVAPPKRPD